MRINNPQNYSIQFQAGLTKQMASEISHTCPERVSAEFSKYGIPTDFKNNQVIAWCSLKSLEWVQNLKKLYNINLGLPKGIFAENFNQFKTKKNGLGFTNIFPTTGYYKDSRIVTDRTIFFNTNHDWNNIDFIADEEFEQNQFATDFFMEIFFHEFCHVFHENNMLNKFSSKKFVEIMKSAQNMQSITNFLNKYNKLLTPICEYAATSPFEAVACDLSKRIIENTDKTTILPESNPIAKSPYKKAFFCKKTKLDKALKNFWNGHFD